MSIQTKFYNAVLASLTDMISKLGTNVANETEFRLGVFTGQFNPGQKLLQFKSIIENCQKRKYKLVEEWTFDIHITEKITGIALENIRIQILGLIEIRKFCLDGKISKIAKKNLRYMTKDKLVTHDLHEYGLRGQLSKE